jgi:putative peptidoglycan lipid II flippase
VHAVLVAAGILLSRLAGLVRQRVFYRYFGISDAADAFTQAFRIPNFLQNLFGEGVLSASFIPVYSRLLAEGDEEEAGRVAGAIAAILTLVTTVLVLAGVLATPLLIDAIAPGFTGDKRELTIRIVRVLFPGIGLLVLSAWCLGILNSHRRFFLSYAAPVVSSAAMIAAMLAFRRQDQASLAITLAWGAVVGSALQFGIQLPTVLQLVKKLRFQWTGNVRTVLQNFTPVFFSRGVVQISAYIDSMFASLLGTGAAAALAAAQTLNTLPVSLFGMAVSAAELPAMSSARQEDLQQRLNTGLRRIAYFVVPSAMAFIALGDVVTAAIFLNGEFTVADSRYVWGILAGSGVGLLASTMGRLYSSAFYALRDTRTPLRFAIVRVVLTTVLGWLAAFPLKFGVAGLTASAGVAGWVEFVLLRSAFNRRVGTSGIPPLVLAKLWASALIAAAAAWAVRGLPNLLILAVYGVVYLGVTLALQVSEGVFDFLLRLRRRNR